MATVIKIRNGGQNSVPSSLQQGEFAINVDNGNLYYGSGSTNTVKQDISLQTLRISGSQTLGTNIDANTPVIGTNMNSGVEEGTILINGSFNGSGEWDVNLAAIPDTNHSVQLSISSKITRTDAAVLVANTTLNALWSGTDYTTSGNLTGISYIGATPIPSTNLAKIFNLATIFGPLYSDTNFSLEGPTTIDGTDCALINWSNMASYPLDADFNNADYELVINYKVNKY
jgi:hypothetical protein